MIRASYFFTFCSTLLCQACRLDMLDFQMNCLTVLESYFSIVGYLGVSGSILHLAAQAARGFGPDSTGGAFIVDLSTILPPLVNAV
jgi:hypothetical protein